MNKDEVKSCGMCGVEIRDLTVTADGKNLLEHINLDIHCGDLVALIGSNGAGKSTLLKAILGERKYSGSIEFVDHCGCGIPHAHVGYVPQHFYFDRSSSVSVCDFLDAYRNRRPVFMGHTKISRERVLRMLQTVDCPHLIDRRLGDLSGGELQRIMLAFATHPVPDVLILDEPISGVDQRGMDLFYRLVADLRKRHHIGILLVSHDFSVVEKYATRVVLLDKTILAQGSAREVFDSHVFRETFGGSFVREAE